MGLYGSFGVSGCADQGESNISSWLSSTAVEPDIVTCKVGTRVTDIKWLKNTRGRLTAQHKALTCELIFKFSVTMYTTTKVYHFAQHKLLYAN